MLAKWYVYELIDPRDGLAFYVGKGCKDRISAHDREAAKLHAVCSEKVLRIRDIWRAGLETQKLVVANFWNEQAAYDYEEDRVAEYGLEALTNIIPGGGSIRGSFIRRKQPVPLPETAERYADTIAKSWPLAKWFAIWLRGETKKYDVVGPLPGVIHFAYEKLFPRVWEFIRNDRGATDMIAPRMREFGVVFDYGSQNP